MTNLPDWLTKRLELTPHKTALEIKTIEGVQKYTWHELAALIAQVVEALTEQGVHANDRVALLMGNGLPFVIAVHALIQCRAVIVPLNTRLTPTELTWQLRDVGATLLLTENAHASIASESTRILTLNLSPFTTGRPQGYAPTEDLPVATTGDHKGTTLQKQNRKGEMKNEKLSFPLTPYPLLLTSVHSILYTSGTTGKPKGVMLTYGNHWWSAMGSSLNLGMREEDKWLLVLPLFHVGGLSMLFKSVIYGNALQLHERFEVEAVNHALDHDGITHVSLVATMLQRLLDAREDTPYPSTLRTVLLGGGPCPPPLLERCARLGIPVVQTYGMTETASQSVTLAPQDALRKLGSAGKPLFPTELRIENEGQPVPFGEIGEILLRGPNVTVGYADRPEATAEAIRNGWLHTGDLGYVDEEGYLYIVNRRTDLIISGGENIYPAEIETVLLSHPAVAEVAVVGINDEQWGQRGAAAVVLTGEDGVSIEALQTYAAERLAKYKVPRTIKIVSELPRNAGGKVVRNEVRDLFEGDV
jgi:o-succinylbenzoate---CoA ligase